MRVVLGSLAVVLAATGFVQTASAQVFFERKDLAFTHGWSEGQIPETDASGQRSYRDEGWRKKMLSQFPKADLNGDGTLTEAEAVKYHMTQSRMFTPQGRELEFLPKSVSRYTVRVPMRDGQTLPTEIYLPGGEGPWPVVLCRTSRGRIDSALDYGNELLRMGYAFVGQDLTPAGDFIDADQLGRETGRQNLNREQRAQFNSQRGQRNAGEDGYDTIEWLAAQPWCNGKIAMTGYSEASSQSKNALANVPPHLSAIITSIGTITRQATATVRSGGGRGGNANVRPTNWSPPGANDTAGGRRGGAAPGGGRRTPSLVEAAPKINVFINDRTGWFDAAVQGDLEEWNALKHTGRATLVLGIGAHGPAAKETRQAPTYGDCDLVLREAEQFKWLKGEIKEADLRSRVYYFLMGDATSPEAPGNVWKVTDVWPVPNTPTSWYLTSDGKLSSARPAPEAAARTYTYDPKDPAPTFEPGKTPSSPSGPHDQSHLKGRKDVLRFDTDPLAQPVEMTGSATIELFVSTDAPDTNFIACLVDVYPDGYEWPIRDSAATLRLREGTSSPQPARKGEVYKLTMTTVPTALVINKGHRLGVRISSSSFPKYEIHPNTWDAIASYDAARVAENAVQVSAEHPSRIILPVVAPGAVKDYRAD